MTLPVIEWSKLQSVYNTRQQDLENALLRLGQFREALRDLIGWIRDTRGKLSLGKPPGIVVETLEEQLADLKV